MCELPKITAGSRGAVNRKGVVASNKHNRLKGLQYLRDEYCKMKAYSGDEGQRLWLRAGLWL